VVGNWRAEPPLRFRQIRSLRKPMSALNEDHGPGGRDWRRAIEGNIARFTARCSPLSPASF